jgi:hypothetical protein
MTTTTDTPEIARLKAQAFKDAGSPQNITKIDIRPINNTQVRINIWVTTHTNNEIIDTSKIAYSAIYTTTTNN